MRAASRGVVWLVASLALAACDLRTAAPEQRPEPASLPARERQRLETLGSVAQDAAKSVPATSGAAAGAARPPDSAIALAAMAASRKLVRTGELTLEVERYEAAANQAARIAQGHGGFVSAARATRVQRGHEQGRIDIRVPAERFADALAALKSIGEVRAESIQTEDVTKAYADLETRLRVKRDTAGRLRDILRHQTAKLSDLLEAERELARVTEEIETLEGERRYYDHAVTLSTIKLTLQEPQAVVEAGWLDPLRRALRGSLELLVASIAALLSLLVLLLPWSLVALLAWRGARRWRRRNASGAATSADRPGVPA